MVADGFALERYGQLHCGVRTAAHADPPRPARLRSDEPPAGSEAPQRPIDPGNVAEASPPPERTKISYVPPKGRLTGPAWALFAAWLAVANIAAYWAFAIDKNRARAGYGRGTRRIPEPVLLGLAAIGGSIGAVIAQRRLRHKTQKQPFAVYLLLIIGVQAGTIIGLALFSL
jgi:uncharacterized membrane protein YsdA (DUF1294 family)